MDEHDISCPYCGETIGLLIDCSVEHQQYTEDCQVCCSPILLTVTATADGELSNVDAIQENG
ncbi:CPXCG motif-containing cysteine-rich protein [Chromatiales bacterium (ex Bugula neritina AB1)]|nr:CPXCG motif-containing cysteine-rich protein [Chromatiales bacterium (ex Bugula neritina AB1)]